MTSRDQIRQRIVSKKGDYKIRDYEGYSIKVHRDGTPGSSKLSLTAWDQLEPEAVFTGTFEESNLDESFAEFLKDTGILSLDESVIDKSLVVHEITLLRRSAPTVAYILKRELIPASIVLRNEMDRLRFVGAPKNLPKPQRESTLDEAFKKINIDPESTEQFVPEYIYGKIEFISQNYAKAADFFRRAAYKGHALSQNSLGLCHEMGGDFEGAVRWFQESADLGCADGENNLGRCYLQGIGLEKDFKKAFELFLHAGEQDDMEALNNLGLCYQYGTGVQEDIEKAVDYYERAAEKGHPGAQNNLGLCFEHGYGVDQDPVMAVALYQKAARQNDFDAQKNLASCYHRGVGVTMNPAEAIRLYKGLVDGGKADTTVFFELGTLYYSQMEYDDSVRAFRQAAHQGHPGAQKALGDCYHYGHGLRPDVTAAVRWYQRAADQGHADAQNSLAYCYFEGRGVSQNYEMAVHWYQAAADQGHSAAIKSLGSAMKSLGDEFFDGTDTLCRDEKEAAKWYIRASELGSAAAQNKLGYCYEMGIGVGGEDHQKAIKWYEKAAEQGLAHGQYNLGVCYEKGRGVGIDPYIALAWYQKAAVQSHKQAQSAVERLTSKRRQSTIWG